MINYYLLASLFCVLMSVLHNIQRAKVNAAVEQAVQSEKSAATANKKVKQVEGEMDKLREQHRKTPEVALMHQLAELKGQLADYQRRMEELKAEIKRVTAEKEQFRSNVHKLVSLAPRLLSTSYIMCQ